MTTAIWDDRSRGLHSTSGVADEWRVDPMRSNASFTAVVAGRAVRGRVPLRGHAIVRTSIEDSVVQLYAASDALRSQSAMVDRILTGSGFLEADEYPTISFRSDMLVRVPDGHRAVGHLTVKGIKRPLVCEFDVDSPTSPASGAMTVNARWIIDSRWITSQWVPTLERRIAMSCFVILERPDRGDARRLAPAA